MRYYIKAFRNYANVRGRANRKEFWLFALFNCIISGCCGFVDGYFGLIPENPSINLGFFSIIYLLFAACPGICLSVRRLHDVGKSSDWWFLGLLPILNLYVWYLYLKAGNPGINKYGPPPGVAIPQSQYQKQEANMRTFVVDHSTGEVVSEISHEHRERPAAQIKFCRMCGCALLEDSNFCSACGTRVIREG